MLGLDGMEQDRMGLDWMKMKGKDWAGGPKQDVNIDKQPCFL